MKDIDLAKIFDSMKSNDISEVVIKDGGRVYEIRRGGFKQISVPQTASQPIVQNVTNSQPQSVSVAPAQTVVSSGDAKVSSAQTESKSNLFEVKSPLVGTFYASPKPDAPPFVEIGTKVSKGKVLCIVEAMKNFNEIECEVDGIVREILIKPGELVEFGKALFRIEV
ncbi:MAG TPA: acetyl-CoA carboxylase biotin carboxyl carrier protein [Spirochaetota bacterium]|nr:acetyl-CoA carboxylase biotin carboxyl carrier protein [Spirochaetota bacterium]